MFERYGGFERVSGLVLAFYDRVLASERLGPFFRDCDMRRLIEHQSKYVSAVMGGPDSHSDAELRGVHAGLGIEPAHFDEMLDLMRAAMLEQGFEQDDTEAVLRRLAGLRRVIVEG